MGTEGDSSNTTTASTHQKLQETKEDEQIVYHYGRQISQ